MPWRWSRVIASLALSLVCLSGCGSLPGEPIRADDAAFRSSHRANHPAWGPISLRHVRDERPGWEYGRFNYLNESYYSEEIFQLPVPATLKRLFYRELQASGAFVAEQDLTRAHYLLDVTIHHYYLKTDRDLLTILPVVPALSTEIRVDLEIRLTDGDGREFLHDRFDSESPESAALLTGLAGSGADRLVAITAAFLESMIRDLDAAVPRFWAELGRSVPAPGEE